MKKTLFFILAVFLIAGCNEVKQYPTSVLELSAGGNDTADFNFEDGSVHGFTYSTTDNKAFKSAENSEFRSYAGKRSMRIWAEFKSAGGESAGTVYTVPAGGTVDMSGKKITARIWLPKEAFESNPTAAYGASFYVKTSGTADGDIWHQSPWTNLLLGGPGVNGVWSEISVNVDDMKKPDPPYGDGSLITTQYDVRSWGIKVGKGDLSPEYSGYIYIDSIDIE